MTDLGLGLVFIYLFDYYLFSLSLFSSLLFSLISSSLFIYYQLSVSHPLSIIHTCCSFDLITHILSLSLPLSLFLSLSINQSINHHPYVILSSHSHPLLLFTIFSEKHFFTAHSHRTFTQVKSHRTSNRCNIFIPINTNSARPYTSYHSFV